MDFVLLHARGPEHHACCANMTGLATKLRMAASRLKSGHGMGAAAWKRVELQEELHSGAGERSRGSIRMTRCPQCTEGSAEAARTDAARKLDACAFSMLISTYGAACAPLVSARVACLRLVWLLHWCILCSMDMGVNSRVRGCE